MSDTLRQLNKISKDIIKRGKDLKDLSIELGDDMKMKFDINFYNGNINFAVFNGMNGWFRASLEQADEIRKFLNKHLGENDEPKI